jgi:uncharacterized protein HemY
VAFDSAVADAHAALGRVLMQNYRFSEAEVSLKRAFELLPKKARGNDLSGRPEYAGEFLVWLYVFMGRPRDAMHYAELNERANPRSPTAIAEVARALIVNGRCDEAMQVLGSLASLDPPPARVPPIAAQCYAQRQMWQKAVDVLRAGAASRGASQAGAWLGFMLARAGQTAEAHEIRDRLLEHANSSVGAYQLVTIYAGLREYDKAFEWLDRAVEDRSHTFTIMEHAFEELRRDPRFDRLRERLGIHKRDG